MLILITLMLMAYYILILHQYYPQPLELNKKKDKKHGDLTSKGVDGRLGTKRDLRLLEGERCISR